MRKLDIKLPVLAFLLSTFTTAEISATNTSCSSGTQHTNICTQKTSESDPKDICVANENIKQHFIDNPYSFAGDCSEFDINKVQTYACNAGLRFNNSSNNICIRRDQDNLPSRTCGDSLNCSCTSTPKNEMGTNYFNVEKATYTGSSSPSFIPYSLNSSTTEEYTTASKSSGNEILKDGSALQFNLGSDFYGAEYFIDICIKNKNLELSGFKLDLSGNILFANSIFNKVNYVSSSGLNTEVETTCVTSNGHHSSPITSLTSGSFISGQRNFKNASIPSAKLCVVRHYFKEAKTEDIRKSNFKKVTFQTTTNVTPKDESLLKFKTPISFCNIYPTSKPNKYTCEEWTSNSNEDFIAALKANNFFGENTYTGQCRPNCKPF